MFYLLFNHYLLCLYIIAVDQSQHVNARGHCACRDGACTVSTEDDASHHVNHLNDTITVDDDLSIVDEGEVVAIT